MLAINPQMDADSRRGSGIFALIVYWSPRDLKKNNKGEGVAGLLKKTTIKVAENNKDI